jgi:hypothetical protein
MRLLRYVVEHHRAKGLCPYQIGFRSWITDEERDEMIAWAQANLSANADWHPRAHTWHFPTEEELNAFIAHRRMDTWETRIPQCIWDDAPFEVAGWVTVDSRKHQRLDFEENSIDWFWCRVDKWVVENCQKQVINSSLSPGQNRGRGALLSNYESHFGFESAEEATLFRIRWN